MRECHTNALTRVSFAAAPLQKPARKVVKPEQAEEVRLRRQQPDVEALSCSRLTNRRSSHSLRSKLRKPWHWKSKPVFRGSASLLIMTAKVSRVL